MNLTKKIILVSILVLFASILCNCYKASNKSTSYTETYNEPQAPQKELVFFMASWCGHCKRFEPVWDKFVSKCGSEGLHPNVKLTKLDVDKDTEHHQGHRFKTHQVRGFPTVVLTDVDDTPGTPFNRNRTEEELLSFLNESA